MRKNNKGFSYVELIIVLAIIAVLIGMVSITIGLVSRTNVAKAADKLENTLNQARTTSMARGSSRGTITIRCGNDGWYYYSVGGGEDVKLVSTQAKISLSYSENSGGVVTTSTNTLTSGSAVTISFEQSTGAFRTIPGTSYYWENITIQNGDKIAEITLYPHTGKCEIQ